MNAHEGLSELELAMRQRPGVSADVVIEDLAEALGQDAEVEPPVDLERVASLQGIVSVTEAISSHSGCLINVGGHLRIEVCATDPLTRQRFTVGHEVCHTLLPGFQMQRNFRCNPGGSTPKRGAAINVEWLADVGASELLLPRRFVQTRFDDGPFGWDKIEQTAREYGASLEATARRFVRLSSTPAIFARLVFATSKNNSVPQLRVRSSASSPSLDLFIPPNKSIPRGHPVHRASMGEDIDTVVDMQSLRAPGPYRVAARPYPLPTSNGETKDSVMILGLKASTASVHVR